MTASGTGITATKLTVSAWVKPDVYSANIRFADKGTPDADGWSVGIYNYNAYFTAYINGVRQEVSGTTTLQSDQWYFISVSYDGSVMQVYLNGNLEASLNVMGSMPENSSLLEIGCGQANYYYRGWLDDVKIYNYACVSGVIQAEYNTGRMSGWAQISAGSNHTLGIKNDGTLRAWGANWYGQLGLNNYDDRWVPTLVTGTNWTAVAAGEYHSLALKTDGTLWAWGYNWNGQLGLNDNVTRLVPTQVTGTNWAAIATYNNHNLALKTDGTLWAWGLNSYGQLGLNDYDTRLVPTQITGTSWTAIAAGGDYSLALKSDGTLWAWGLNSDSQLGLGDAISRTLPVQVNSDTDWRAIAAGSNHSLAIKTNNTLWAWGYNLDGQLGLDDTNPRDIPTRVGADSNWGMIVCGSAYTLGIRTNNTLWAWGYNGYGQLGLNDYSPRYQPAQVGTDTNWKKIEAGWYHSAGLKAGGAPYSWGNNNSGQLGLGDTNYRINPTQLGILILPPVPVTSPNPVNGATYVSTYPTLSWSAASGASSYNVYFSAADPPTYWMNTTGTSFNPGTLSYTTTYYWRVDSINYVGVATGTGWTFTTGSNIDPYDPADDVGISGTWLTPITTTQAHSPHVLSSVDYYDWYRINMTAGYFYYFNTVGGSGDNYGELYSDSDGANRVAYNDDSGGNNQFTFYYIAGNTQTYYLRVRHYSPGGNWSGSVNYYYEPPPPPPAQVTSPNPADGATDVYAYSTLYWGAADRATSYDVYFGAANPPVYWGNTNGTNYYFGGMNYITTYYWRIDSVNSSGVTTGTVWAFMTQTVPIYQPDSSIKSGAESDAAYIGDNLYQSSPTISQTKLGAIPGLATISYFVRVQNDGNTVESFRLTGTYTDADWQVKYYDGVSDITSQMTGPGFYTPTVSPSGFYTIRIDVTLNITSPSGTFVEPVVGVSSTYDPSKVDIVKARIDAIPSYYSISGNISYGGSKTGRIYINVNGFDGYQTYKGTSISPTGAYTIRGVTAGSYRLYAWRDHIGQGAKNASNPNGYSGIINVVSSNVTGVNITLIDPSAPAPVTPTGLSAFPADSSAFVFFDTARNISNTEIAESYKVYWKVGSAPTKVSYTGVKTVAAKDDGNAIITGLTNGNALYFAATALVGVTESDMSSAFGPVIIGAPAGNWTVSGTVSYTGVTPTGPLYVGVYGDQGVTFTRIASPAANSQGYSVSGIANGTYMLWAVMDMNNNGAIDAGDIQNTNGGSGETVTINDADISNKNQILSTANSAAETTTEHRKMDTGESYSVRITAGNGKKLVVAVAITSGPGVTSPIDISKDREYYYSLERGLNRPITSDIYAVTVTYSDATTETVNAPVSAVLDSFALNLAPAGIGGSVTPLFTWEAPIEPPAYYTYSLYLYRNFGSDRWEYPKDMSMPSSQLSVLYNADGRASQPSLTIGEDYNWYLTVLDSNSNRAVQGVSYRPTGVDYQPDAMIKSGIGSDASYLTDNLYESNPITQTRTRIITGPETVSYFIKVQNDGLNTDSYLITGTGGNSLWQVKYWDGVTEITTQVTGAGFYTTSMSPGNSYTIRLDVTAISSTSGLFMEASVNASSTNDTGRKDTVKARTEIQNAEDNYVWVANMGSNNVSRILKSNPAISITITVGTNPQGVAVDATYVWVANQGSNNVTRIRKSDSTTTTIAVGNTPYGVAVDETYCWVVNYGSNNVTRILKSNTAISTTIGVGNNPRGVALDGTYVWVANSASANVTRIKKSDLTTTTIAVETQPIGVVVDETYCWVANYDSNNVTRINKSDSTTTTITAGTNPVGVAIDETYCWVANNGSSNVTRILKSDPAITTTIMVGNGPFGVAVDGIYCWVANRVSNNVTRILKSDLTKTTIAVGTNPYSLGDMTGYAYNNYSRIEADVPTAVDDYVWVANNYSNDVSRIKKSDSSTTTIVVGSAPNGVAADETYVWVSNVNSNNVTRINKSDLTTTTIDVGYSPYGVAVDATYCWVSNYSSNSVTRILKSDLSITTITVGSGPVGIAVDATYVWTANYNAGTVTRILKSDLSTTGIVVGSNPYGITVDGTYCWTANYGSGDVTRILKSDSSTTSIYVGANPFGVAADATYCWVTNSGSSNVTKILKSDSSTSTIAVGSQPCGVSLDATYAWVANNGSYNVTRILKSDSSTTTIGVGNGPYSVGDMTGYAYDNYAK